MARMQAGLQLKNALYSKDIAIKHQHQQRWLHFPHEMRELIKNNVSRRISFFVVVEKSGTFYFKKKILLN